MNKLAVLDTPDIELDSQYMPVQFAKALLPFLNKERDGSELGHCLVECDGNTVKYTTTDGHGLVQLSSAHCWAASENRLISRATLKEYVTSKGHSPLTYSNSYAGDFPDYQRVVPAEEVSGWKGHDGTGRRLDFGISTRLWTAVNKVIAAIGKGHYTGYTPMRFQGTCPLSPFRIDIRGHIASYTEKTGPLDVLLVIMPMRLDS